jgi:succinate dehydrogenase/fumarate reductase flavoprotein subunit
MMKTEVNPLLHVEKLKKRIESKVLLRSFCWVMWEENYVYSMENIERMFTRYLEKVKTLEQEYGLDDRAFLQFRHETANLIYEAALQRNEFRWSIYFQKKYRL